MISFFFIAIIFSTNVLGCYRKCGFGWWRKDTCWLSQLIMFLYKSIVYLLLFPLYIFHIIMQGSTISHLPSVLISKDFLWNFSLHSSRRFVFLFNKWVFHLTRKFIHILNCLKDVSCATTHMMLSGLIRLCRTEKKGFSCFLTPLQPFSFFPAFASESRPIWTLFCCLSSFSREFWRVF